MKISEALDRALIEYKDEFIDRKQARDYVMMFVNKWVAGLNEDCATLGRMLKTLVQDDPESEEYKKAFKTAEWMLSPKDEEERKKVQADKLKRQIDLEYEKNKIEFMKQELEHYKTRSRKATIKFTGDQFKEFIKNISKRDTNASEVHIEIEHGQNNYKLHFLR